MHEKSIENNNPVDFFEGNHLYIYLYKKAEKLASALYVVTNLIGDGEILKGLLREKSISVFSDTMQLQKMSLTNASTIRRDLSTKTQDVSSDTLLSGITEVISLLEIANVSGYISEMNFSVLKREYVDLGTLIKTRREEIVSDNVRLPKEFFDVPNLYETRVLKQGITKEKKDISIKDTKKVSNITTPTTQKTYKTNTQRESFIKDTSNAVSNVARKQKGIEYSKTADIRHNSRRNTILELLQSKAFVTVTDVTDAIEGCSSKTLQRELLSLVSEGILIKKGERRWSTYSLA
jgi:hypothetical protein